MTGWRCAVCGRDLPPRERVGRRDTCSGCGAELHACRQCIFYEPGAYNDCREPQAERVLEKDRANFCDYFALGPADGSHSPRAGHRGASGDAGTPAPDARAKLDALFGKKIGTKK